MSINIVFIMIAVILLIAAIIIHFNSIRLTNELYIRLVKENEEIENNENLTESPYSIRRIYGSHSKSYIYQVFCNNDIVKTPIFYNAKSAQNSMNELEKLGGFKITKVV